MELRRREVLWSAFTDELEKIAAGKMPNPAQLMKIKAQPRMPSPVPTPAQNPVLPAMPPATSNATGQAGQAASVGSGIAPNIPPAPVANYTVGAPAQPMLGGRVV